uniref:Uncharacterized protein n=1 Tax=Cacopsylla melanoneura TaxID=428564 RepID=A0A8D8Z3N3_9HEMI
MSSQNITSSPPLTPPSSTASSLSVFRTSPEKSSWIFIIRKKSKKTQDQIAILIKGLLGGTVEKIGTKVIKANVNYRMKQDTVDKKLKILTNDIVIQRSMNELDEREADNFLNLFADMIESEEEEEEYGG